MYRYLSLKAYDVYNTDTDSVFLYKNLPDTKIGDNLGLMKYEGCYKKAIFISPKVYGTINQDGKDNIKFKRIRGGALYFENLEGLLIRDSNVFIDQLR